MQATFQVERMSGAYSRVGSTQRARCGPGVRASELAKGDLSAHQGERCDLGNGGCTDWMLESGPSFKEQAEELGTSMMKDARFVRTEVTVMKEGGQHSKMPRRAGGQSRGKGLASS